MSFARQFLYTIADQMGRPRKDLDGYIVTLQKNWFDTKDAMKSMKAKDFDKLDFPSRLSGMIMERLGTNASKIGGSTMNHPSNKVEKMQVENPISQNINSLKNKLSKSDFDEVLNMLIKIFSNVRDKVTDEKYRTLKRSNQKVAKLIKIREVEKILQYGNFTNEKIGFVMQKVDLALLDECIGQLSKYVERVKFNPYEQSILSVGKSTIDQYQGQSSVSYNDKLAELEKQRQKMMSKPVKDRDVRIFQVKAQNSKKMDVEFKQKEDMNEDERIYMQNVKQILKKASEDPKFMNRRKKQYYDLLKQPCYTETLVRVKLPDNYIFEAKFSPLETLETLTNTFHEYVQDRNLQYTLYMTPPVQNLKGVILRKSFYELGCVPKAIFHFKTDEKIKGPIMRTKKSGLFGLFK